jgi:hypothetical protein
MDHERSRKMKEEAKAVSWNIMKLQLDWPQALSSTIGGGVRG